MGGKRLDGEAHGKPDIGLAWTFLQDVINCWIASIEAIQMTLKN